MDGRRYVALRDALDDLKDILGMIEVATYYVSLDGDDGDAIEHSFSAIRFTMRDRLQSLEKLIEEIEPEKSIAEEKLTHEML